MRAADRTVHRWEGRRSPRFLAVVVAVAVGLGVASCASPAPETAATAPASRDVFTAQTPAGEVVSFPADKATVLFFFSVECGTCGPSAAVIAEVQRDDPDAATFVAVDVAYYESAAAIESFLTQNNATSLAYTIDTDASILSAYGVDQLSTVVVLNAAGEVVYREFEPSSAQLRDALQKAGAP
jgi:hypothetical protein|uniref:Putative export protein n=1 Tax=Rhodococcus sp. Mel TaxID=1093626 RepID=H8ZKW7_9NOCA|nr:putative export protein [Rhodococcus sp. Mel]